jgi:two-component sensor histidine kinase
MAASSEPYSDGNIDLVRSKIIGLGDRSIRKSYYPQLRETIRDLREQREHLMELVRLLEEREEELEQLLDEKDELLREVHHRVKNNFQIVASLLNLGMDMLSDGDEHEIFYRTKQRIDTMARVYEEILRREEFSKVDLCDLIRLVTEQYEEARRGKQVELSLDLDCPGRILDLDLAVPFALIVNEVVGNAFEHAFPGGAGLLYLRLYRSGSEGDKEGILTFELTDNGPSFAKRGTNSEAKRLGIALLKALVAQIGGAFSYEDQETGLGIQFILRLKRPT